MHPSEIDTELVRANPWWRDVETWEQRDVQLQAVRRSPLAYRPRPLDALKRGGLYILRGPRRVGKSTALKQFIRERIEEGHPPRRILHVSVEGRSARDVTDVVRRGAEEFLQGEPGQRIWLLDEITGVEGAWPAAIKRLRDHHLDFASDTVVLTGSSSAGFDEARKLFGGRRGGASDSERVLFQMPFTEVLEARGSSLPPSPRLSIHELEDPARLNEAISEARPWVPELVEKWEDYLQVGGYPQAVSARVANGGSADGLVEALRDVVHGDAFAKASMTQTQTQTLLRRVSASLGSLLSERSVADHIDLGRDATRRRLDALRRSFLAFPVPREQGLSPRARSQAKWYFTDPLLARLAAHRGAGQPPDRTALSEQQVGLALLRVLEREESGAAIEHDRLLYYRSSTGAEIDFMSPDVPDTCIESKYVDRRWGRAFQTIEASGRSVGLVATRSGLERRDGGWALPAGLLVYLMGV